MGVGLHEVAVDVDDVDVAQVDEGRDGVLLTAPMFRDQQRVLRIGVGGSLRSPTPKTDDLSKLEELSDTRS